MTSRNTTTEGERAHAMRRTICVRLDLCSPDELRVIDRLLSRVEKGRATYGPLDLATNYHRVDDWRRELAEEREDFLVYQAIIDVVDHARVVEAIEKLEADEVVLDIDEVG
jgi:hypothetical protein